MKYSRIGWLKWFFRLPALPLLPIDCIRCPVVHLISFIIFAICHRTQTGENDNSHIPICRFEFPQFWFAHRTTFSIVAKRWMLGAQCKTFKKVNTLPVRSWIGQMADSIDFTYVVRSLAICTSIATIFVFCVIIINLIRIQSEICLNPLRSINWLWVKMRLSIISISRVKYLYSSSNRTRFQWDRRKKKRSIN